MRWPMSVLANELITALVPPARIPALVARGWWYSHGDDEWRSLVGDPERGTLVGAYAIPVTWRQTITADNKPSLRTDATAVANVTAHDPVAAEWLWSAWATVPQWVLVDAETATAKPQPGVDPSAITVDQLSRPFPDGGPDLAYRKAQLDGVVGAVRNMIEH